MDEPQLTLREQIATEIDWLAMRPSFLALEFERLGIGTSPRLTALAKADRILALVEAARD